MIACLRSTRFQSADRQSQVFLDLRRLMDINALAASRHTKQFVVTKRMSLAGRPVITKKNFDTKTEARSYWLEQAMILTDTGMTRLDIHISGFHGED